MSRRGKDYCKSSSGKWLAVNALARVDARTVGFCNQAAIEIAEISLSIVQLSGRIEASFSSSRLIGLDWKVFE